MVSGLKSAIRAAQLGATGGSILQQVLFDIFIDDLENETDGANLQGTPHWGDQLTYWRLWLPFRVALTSWKNGPVKANQGQPRQLQSPVPGTHCPHITLQPSSNSAEKDLAILVDKRRLGAQRETEGSGFGYGVGDQITVFIFSGWVWQKSAQRFSQGGAPLDQETKSEVAPIEVTTVYNKNYVHSESAQVLERAPGEAAESLSAEELTTQPGKDLSSLA